MALGLLSRRGPEKETFHETSDYGRLLHGSSRESWRTLPTSCRMDEPAAAPHGEKTRRAGEVPGDPNQLEHPVFADQLTPLTRYIETRLRPSPPRQFT